MVCCLRLDRIVSLIAGRGVNESRERCLAEVERPAEVTEHCPQGTDLKTVLESLVAELEQQGQCIARCSRT